MQDPRETMAAMARSAVLGAVLLMLLATAWVLLVAGGVVLLAGAIGMGPALIAVGVGLVLFVVLVLAIARLTRPPARPAPAPAGHGAEIIKTLARMAAGATASPGSFRMVLIAATIVMGLAAIFLPGSDHKDGDDDAG